MPGVGVTAATTRLSRVKETAWGVNPTTPAFKNLRLVSESLTGDKQTTRSNELRPDRNNTDEILTGLMGSGSIETEFSYASFDDDLAALLFNNWENDILVNGVTPTSFLFEKTNDIPGGGKLYQRFGGGMYNTLSLSISAGEIITGTWGVMAKTVDSAAAIIAGATYADGGITDVMSAGAHVGSITATGIADVPVIQSMTLDITNNLRQRMAVGTLGSVGIGEGRFDVSGSFNAYFTTRAFYDAFIANDDIGLQMVLGQGAGSRYRLNLARLKLSTGTLVAGGNDSDLMFNCNFTGLYEPGIEATIEIERNF